MSEVGKFTIAELQGEERRIELAERALPFRPFTLEGTHTLVDSGYPGSGVQGQQAVGARNGPTQISGEWNDIYLYPKNGNGPAVLTSSTSEVVEGFEALVVSNEVVRTARELAGIVDDMRQRGSALRVSWLHVVRFGRISKFTQKWKTSGDLDWDLEFTWISQTEAIGMPTPEAPNAVRDTQAIGAAIKRTASALSFPSVEDLDPGFIETVDRALGEMQAGTQEAEQAARNMVSGVSEPIDLVRRALSVTSQIKATALGLVDELAVQVGASAQAGMMEAEDLSEVDPATQLALEVGVLLGMRSSRDVAHEAARRRVLLVRSVDETVLHVVIVREGDDCRVLARRYYGDVNAWDRIRKFNGLSTSTLEVGDVVLIPALQVAA